MCFRDSIFDWVLFCPIYWSGSDNVVSFVSRTPNCESEDLSLFWEVEKVPETRQLTLAERHCEEHFNELQDGMNGLFVVRITFNMNPTSFFPNLRIVQMKQRVSFVLTTVCTTDSIFFESIQLSYTDLGTGPTRGD